MFSEETDSSKSTSLIERESIPGTPFELITLQEGSMIVWGKFKISKMVDTKEECLELLRTELWNIIAVYVYSLVDKKAEIELHKRNKINNQ